MYFFYLFNKTYTCDEGSPPWVHSSFIYICTCNCKIFTVHVLCFKSNIHTCTCTCIFSFSDYKEYHTDTTVKFVITLTESKMSEAESVGFHKKFKLETAVNTTNLVCTCVHVCTLYTYRSIISISIISLRRSISIFYLYLSTSIYCISYYVYIYLYFCMCVACTHTHTLTHMYMYM